MNERSPFKHAKADDSAGFLLWKLTALWQRKLAVVFDGCGITQTHYAVMASLRWFEDHREPTTQALLAKHARIEPMTLSKAFRRLEDNGLVVRKQSAVDSRAITVRLTAKGRKLTQKAVVAVEDADDEFFGRLDGPALGRFKSLVVALIDGNDPLASATATPAVTIAAPPSGRGSLDAGGSARRFWIGVASRTHVKAGVEGGFIQLNHGKKAALRRLKAGDGLIMYSPRTAYPVGEPLQAFTAIGTVLTGDVYQVEVTPDFKPHRVDVRFVPSKEAPIKPLIERLSFIRSQSHWGAAFRFGHVEITAGDFALIADRMAAAPANTRAGSE
jgi:MarR family transcriptional regulator for hemolysin